MDGCIGWVTMLIWLVWDNGIVYYWHKLRGERYTPRGLWLK